jgi:hypothetical protein
VRTFNHPRLDFDLRFVVSGAAALAARLPAGERGCVRPLWDAASWAAAERRQQLPQVGCWVGNQNDGCPLDVMTPVEEPKGPGAGSHAAFACCQMSGLVGTQASRLQAASVNRLAGYAQLPCGPIINSDRSSVPRPEQANLQQDGCKFHPLLACAAVIYKAKTSEVRAQGNLWRASCRTSGGLLQGHRRTARTPGWMWTGMMLPAAQLQPTSLRQHRWPQHNLSSGLPRQPGSWGGGGTCRCTSQAPLRCAYGSRQAVMLLGIQVLW